ncbi:molybdopterin-guanine dinucleotide biosynthesis protein B [Paenibacillus agricola]|uniref:Molybdopterin-guanine dinucleotide biosynthesis protein B n=1 Tax=Paenibacillus agricola TaxID=2716264 RepID=A0ABX0J5J9_9BACL|nr:molybdopterin-guanine dinucleotide biosynthesis protein B [Paenibacillus agricola]NHN31238.1 molybdopterin-guanine dinucleotide biosynthesis protein B [Paenibacillus agricola]
MTVVIGFTGYSNSGKTRLISRLVHYFALNHISCAVVKHDAHGHYREATGSDSAQFIEAGAAATVVVSPNAYVTYKKVPTDLDSLLPKLQAEGYDLIMVEGFKQGNHDKIALFRNEEQSQIISNLPHLPIAVVAPEPLREYSIKGVPFFDPDDLEALANWIKGRFNS